MDPSVASEKYPFQKVSSFCKVGLDCGSAFQTFMKTCNTLKFRNLLISTFHTTNDQHALKAYLGQYVRKWVDVGLPNVLDDAVEQEEGK